MAASDLNPTQPTRRAPRGPLLRAVTRRVPRRVVESAPQVESAPRADDATRLVKEAKPAARVSVGSARLLPLGVLAPGTLLCGDCTVRETMRPHETTRPGLYDCDAPEGRVMIKIAAALHPPREELWRRLPELRHPALLQTHRVQKEGDFFAEVQEFCEGGTLDDALPREGNSPIPRETLERGVIAPFFAGLQYLHERGVVHRDIKPKNLYLRRQNGRLSLAIGDFDISSLVELHLTSRDTVRAAGTHFYMAPEAFPRFVDPDSGQTAAIVSPASDYYSFGVVLVELLSGTSALHSGRWSDVYDFYMAGGRVAVPGCDERLRELMQGLLIRNRRTRWGAPEASRWLAGQTSDLDRQKIRDDAGYELGARRASRPYNVFPSAPIDLPSLARALVEEPKIGEEELLRSDVLLNWIGEIDVKVARDIRRDREQWMGAPRLALFHAVLRLDPDMAFSLGPGLWIENIESFPGQIEEWVRQKKTTLHKVVSRSTLFSLEAWLRLGRPNRPDLAQSVAIMRQGWWPQTREGSTLTSVDARIAWEEMRWMLDPNRPYLVAPNVVAHSPREFARACYGQARDWNTGVPSTYRAGLERWREGWLGAWLRQRLRDENGDESPLVAQIERLRFKDTVAPEATFETVLRLLDPDLPLVELRFHGTPAPMIVEWGAKSWARVPFEAVGPGLPFGAWTLENAPPGLRIEPLQIGTRSGEVMVSLDSRDGLSPGSAGRASLVLAQGGTVALKHPLALSFRIAPPDTQRKQFIRNGMLLGGAIAGGARLLAFACTGTQWSPDAPQPASTTATTTGTTTPDGRPAPAISVDPNAPDASDQPPPMSYLSASSLLIAGFVIAFYVWLDALKKHAQ